MKNVFLTIISLLFFSFCGVAQNIDKITHKCPSPNQSVFASAAIVRNDIIYTPCPSGSSFFDGAVKLTDRSYTAIGLFNNNPFSIAQSTNRTIPSGGFAAEILDNSLLSTGSGNFFVGQYNNLAIGGGSITHASIFGNLIAVSNRANGILIGGTDTIEGVDIFTNMETPATTGYGVFAYGGTGSADALGTGTFTAVSGTAGMHNSGYSVSLNALEGRVFTSGSVPNATSPLTRNLWLHGTNNSGNILTDWRGISIDSFINTGGTVGTTYAIYIDNTLNGLGSVKNYALYSLSTSPSRLTGDVYISDFNKGIILTSPDGTCYRFTVANGGALNAGVSVTCP